jgi:plasmid stabilization system protein ParE
VIVELSTAAIQDLQSIDTWYFERSGAQLLASWRDAAEEVLDTLARHPEIGAIIHGAARPLGTCRSVRMPGPFGAYRVYYALEPSVLRVLRVLHEARERKRWL